MVRPERQRISRQLNNPRRIVISAGHSNERQGCTYNGLREHDQALRTLTHLKQQLRLNEDYAIFEVWGTLSEKIKRAKIIQPDVAVEVHFNAPPPGHGTETLYLGENSKALASCLQDSMVRVLGLRDRGIKERTNLGWLKLPFRAVIVEPLFLSNKGEADMLRHPATHQAIAAAIVLGIGRFFEQIGGVEPARRSET